MFTTEILVQLGPPEEDDDELEELHPPSTRTPVGSSSSVGFPLLTPTAVTFAVFVKLFCTPVCSQVYSKYSPGSRVALVRSPDPPFTIFDHVVGKVFGRTTFPAQLGLLISVRTILVRDSPHVFVTLILKIALSHLLIS